MVQKDDKADRRTSIRVKRHESVDVKADDETTIRAQLMNISEGGVRFITAECFEVEAKLDLSIKGESYKAIVKHCKKIYGGFAVRVEFA